MVVKECLDDKLVVFGWFIGLMGKFDILGIIIILLVLLLLFLLVLLCFLCLILEFLWFFVVLGLGKLKLKIFDKVCKLVFLNSSFVDIIILFFNIDNIGFLRVYFDLL